MAVPRTPEQNEQQKMTRLSRMASSVTKLFGVGVGSAILAFTLPLAGIMSEESLLVLTLDLIIGFPALALSTLVQAGLAFYEARLKNWKPHPTLRFAVQAVAAIAILTVLPVMLAPFTYSSLMIAGGLIAGTMALKGIYNLGSGLYYIYKACTAKDEESARKAGHKAVTNLLYGAAYMLAASGVGFMTAAFYTAFIPTVFITVSTLLAGALTACAAVYRLWTLNTPTNQPCQEKKAPPATCSTSVMGQQLGINERSMRPQQGQQKAAVDAPTETETTEQASQASQYSHDPVIPQKRLSFNC